MHRLTALKTELRHHQFVQGVCISVTYSFGCLTWKEINPLTCNHLTGKKYHDNILAAGRDAHTCGSQGSASWCYKPACMPLCCDLSCRQLCIPVLSDTVLSAHDSQMAVLRDYKGWPCPLLRTYTGMPSGKSWKDSKQKELHTCPGSAGGEDMLEFGGGGVTGLGTQG